MKIIFLACFTVLLSFMHEVQQINNKFKTKKILLLFRTPRYKHICRHYFLTWVNSIMCKYALCIMHIPSTMFILSLYYLEGWLSEISSFWKVNTLKRYSGGFWLRKHTDKREDTLLQYVKISVLSTFAFYASQTLNFSLTLTRFLEYISFVNNEGREGK